MSEVELIGTSNFIVLASRFEVNESGHFYWFTKSLQRELIRNGIPFKILSRIFPESTEEQFSEWGILPTTMEWGKDTGAISPLKLANLIEKEFSTEGILKSRNIIYTYETSFSLLAALVIILLRNPNSTAAANMLDSGYWQRFFNLQLLSFAPLRASIKFPLKFIGKRLLLFANMSSQAEIISKQIDYPVDAFPHITALNPAEYSFKDFQMRSSSDSLPRILFFTWTEDLPFVCQILSNIEQKSPLLLSKITIHTKSLSDKVFLKTFLVEKNIEGVNIVAGTLSESNYIDLICSNEVTVFPYTDAMHFLNGSGRVIDSLILGKPVILSSESGSCLHARKVNACFTFHGVDPASVLGAIKEFEASPFFSEKSSNLYQEELKSAAAVEFSVGGLLKKVTFKSNERMSNYAALKPPHKLIYFFIILEFQITWTLLNAFHKFSRFFKR